ncbi:LacI family DNA-binding transcriptional regulator [Microbacterium sp.]|uniref:LacI family DNA-binding transcriptional regulator n=1 Tax=Microbacterium sp. TaxID=51671 RepID=UPI003C76AC3B
MSTSPAPRSTIGINDVARFAGVSIGTVSNVLNHPQRVAPKTLERVQHAIDALRYVPNGAARSLAAGESRTIGVVISDLDNSLFIDIARGAEDAAERMSHVLMLANTDGRVERERRALDVFDSARVGGLMLTLNDADHFRSVVSHRPGRTPLVLLNYHDQSGIYDSVYIDNVHGGRTAARHLIDSGRRRIVFVGGPTSLQPIAERRRGFLDAMAEAGLLPMDVLALEAINRADGWRAGRRLVDRVRSGEVDGIVAASDLLAAGIIQAFAEAPDITLPGDVGVIGYDNNRAAWDAPLPITTIGQPGQDLGAAGVELLIERMNSGGTESGGTRALSLTPSLVERMSTRRA